VRRGSSSPTPAARFRSQHERRSPTPVARDAVAEVTGMLRGTVRVATVAVPRRVDVVETIRQFQERNPGVQVYLLHDGAKDLVRLVAEGQWISPSHP
jgi:DNA-binding transcriptional LysR family regulator